MGMLRKRRNWGKFSKSKGIQIMRNSKKVSKSIQDMMEKEKEKTESVLIFEK